MLARRQSTNDNSDRRQTGLPDYQIRHIRRRHELAAATVSHSFADVILVPVGQRVVKYGSTGDLLVAGGCYAKLYSMQTRSYL